MVARDRWGAMANSSDAFGTAQSASEAAQSRVNQLNAQIKEASSTRPQDRWQTGEWGRYLDRLNEFDGRGTAKKREEEKKVVGRVEKVLRDNYKPKGEKVPDEVFVAVSRTAGAVLLTFMLLSSLKPQVPPDMERWLNQDPTGKPWVQHAKPVVEYCLKESGVSLSNEELTLICEIWFQLWRTTNHANIAHIMLVNVMKNDRDKIDSFLPVAEALAKGRELDDKVYQELYYRLRNYIDKDEAEVAERLRTSSFNITDFTAEDAQFLAGVLSSKENLKAFVDLCADVEYSNDYASLVHERAIVGDIVDEQDVRTALLIPIYQAMYDINMTEQRACTLHLRLSRVGRRGLFLSDDDLLAGR